GAWLPRRSCVSGVPGYGNDEAPGEPGAVPPTHTLSRVVLDHEVLGTKDRNLLARRHIVEAEAELVARHGDVRHHLRIGAQVTEDDRFARALTHGNHISRLEALGGDVRLAPIDLEVTVVHVLARGVDADREAGAKHKRVEAGLEELH